MVTKDINGGYKITGLGEIPIGWEIRNIESIVEKIVGGGTPSRDNPEFYSGSIPWITVKDMNGKMYKCSAQEFITDEALKTSATNLIDENSVIVATRIALGRGFINKVPVAINQDLKALYLKKNVESIYFLYWYLSKNSLIKKMGLGSTVKGIRLKQLKKLLLPVPPLKEQRKISEILTAVDEQIENAEQLIEKTKELKKGLMQQLLTRGIGHAEFKQTELGGIPFLWSIKKIGEITEVKTGGTPSRTNNSYWENGTIPWMSSGEINLRKVYNVKEKITEQGYRNSNTTLLPIGTVMLAMNGQGKTRGTAAILRCETTCNQSLAGILPSLETNSDYLYYYLDSCYEELRSITGEGRYGLNLSLIRDFPIKIPPFTEQQKIAEILSTVDEQIDVYEKEKGKQLELKKGLMQQLLTGKIRVTV